MLKYILKRVFYMIFVLLIISVILFIIYKSVPGDPVLIMLETTASDVTPEQYEIMYNQAREKLGLDQPIVIQYFTWLGNMLRGDFGYSTQYRRDVAHVVRAPLGNTLLLSTVNMFFVFIITIPLGIVCAVKRGSVLDKLAQVITVLGYSLPNFIIAILFIYLFAVKLQWFPVGGMYSPTFSGGFWEFIIDRAYFMALPIMVMVASSLGSMTRYVRTSMIEALSMDYVRTARSKGLLEKTVIYSHAFRNGLIPVMTAMAGWFINMFSGTVVIETMFLWNGMGKILIDSLRNRDFGVTLAMQMFFALVAVVVNLLLDVAYSIADPRVRL